MGEAANYPHLIGDAMDQEHAFAEENLPAFVLGALDKDESVRVRKHLERCPQCRAEYRSFEQVVTALAYSVPAIEPPAHLREVIRTLTSAPRLVEVPAWEKEPTATGMPSSHFWKMPQVFLAAVLFITVGLLGWNIHLHRRVNVLQSEVADAHEVGEMLMGYMDNPNAYESYTLNGNGYVASRRPRALVIRDRLHERFLLVAEGLPVEMGTVYLVWLIDREGRQVLIGKLRCDSNGRAVFMFNPPMPLDMISGIRVTINDRDDMPPILDGRLRGNEGFPLFLASTAL